MIEAWRLVRPEHARAQSAFSGEGARLYGGRWNSPGRRVVYLSATLSLAALETLVHADPRAFQRDYVAFRLQLSERQVRALPEAELSPGWRERPLSPGARAVGDAWLQELASLGLWVPSVVIPLERNLLVNPAHPDWEDARISEPIPFRFDARLPRRPQRGRAGQGSPSGAGSGAATPSIRP